MKLKIKFKSDRKIIEIPDGGTLSELVKKCDDIIPSSNWFLSLNGKDKIIGSPESTLPALGLVSGDLLHAVERTSAVNTDLVSQLISMGFNRASVEKVVFTFGATNLNDAIELLSMIGTDSMAMEESANKGNVAKELVPEPIKIHSDKRKSDSMSNNNSTKTSTSKISMERNEQSCESITTNSSKEILPLFLQDGITETFVELFKEVKCSTEADYLCLAVHALMSEARFHTEPTKTDEVNLDCPDNRHAVAKLPDNWKNSEMGLYRLNYIYGVADKVVCCVTASMTGSSLLVTGTIDMEESDAYQVKLKVSDYITSKEISSGKPASIYTNLNKLSHKVKDNISNRMINEIRTKLGHTSDLIDFMTLPEELKLRLICYLDAVSVCRLSQVAREIHALCEDESIWKRLLCREFRASNPTGATYKEAVKHMFIMRRRERMEQERLRTPRMPLRPEFDVGPDLLYPGGPTAMPGIIGGAYDLYPSGGFHPGGFPRHPLHGPSSLLQPDILHGRHPNRNQIRRPPGARFDPYGPVPDDEYNLGPGTHPDTLHRPGFGRGSGFGGGFGFL